MRVSTIIAVVVMMAFAPAKADVLDEIAERGTIRLGVRLAAAPFSFIDAEGKPGGLAVALCRRVAASLSEHLGGAPLKLEIIGITASDRFEKLQRGETHLNCGPTTATLKRRETVDFSVPYFLDGISAALRRGGVQAIDDLNGQPIGAIAGTTAVPLAKSIGGPVGSTLVEYPDYEAGLRALGAGEVEVLFGDQGLLVHELSVLKRQDRSLPVKVIEDQFTYEPYALSMRAGERRLRLEVDRALSEAYSSHAVFDDMEAAFGEFEITELTSLLYGLMALPE